MAAMDRRRFLQATAAGTTLAGFGAGQPGRTAPPPGPADLVLVGGKILTVDADDSVAEAMAVRGGRIAAVGSDDEIRSFIGDRTTVVELNGRTVIPGIVESHSHAIGVARSELAQPYAELRTIGEVQAWIRQRSAQVPTGQWIAVPRTDITRLQERRFPTPAELDAACATHPVVFSASFKHVCNPLGFRTLGVSGEGSTIPDGEIVRDPDGRPVMVKGASGAVGEQVGQRDFSRDEVLSALGKLVRRYNEVGITSVGERASNIEGLRTYQALRDRGELTARVTVTIRVGGRTEEQVEGSIGNLGLAPAEGDDWVKAGPLKITADGGILWGTAYLREPYGRRAMGLYVLDDPEWRGRMDYTLEEMKAIFRTGHRMGWQMVVHVTGDAGVDLALDAMAAADADSPIRGRRFTLIHAYFATPEAIARASRLGVCVDTQPAWYYKDADAVAGALGKRRLRNFIGVADWIKGGVHVAANTDHMLGLDPDHAMNPFNPFLTMYVMVTRRTEGGQVIGARQRISRQAALRAMTWMAAYLSFDEEKVGSLEPGKYADLAVLDRDYLTCPEDDIRRTQVLMTMVDGKIIFERD